jgi:hypothetical protein
MQLGAFPCRIIDLLAGRDHAHRAQHRGAGGDRECGRELSRKAVGQVFGVGQGERRCREEAAPRAGIDQTQGCAEQETHEHADRRAEQPQQATTPDTQPDHDPEREAGRRHMDGKVGLMTLVDGQHILHADDAKLDADDHDDQAAHCRREQSAKARDHRGEAELEQSREHRHSEYRRQAAGLRCRQRRCQINGREDGRGEIARAHRPQAQRLQRG